jgi:hypothetical protein
VKVSGAIFFAVWAFALAPYTAAQGESYQVATVSDGGTTTGSVKWAGAIPPAAIFPTNFPINKDQQVCDPNGQKPRDLERLVIDPEGGVGNTVCT